MKPRCLDVRGLLPETQGRGPGRPKPLKGKPSFSGNGPGRARAQKNSPGRRRVYAALRASLQYCECAARAGLVPHPAHLPYGALNAPHPRYCRDALERPRRRPGRRGRPAWGPVCPCPARGRAGPSQVARGRTIPSSRWTRLGRNEAAHVPARGLNHVGVICFAQAPATRRTDAPPKTRAAVNAARV